MKPFFLILLTSSAVMGQNLDVLTYHHVPNPNGIPVSWVARVERAANRPSPWVEMTPQQLADYKEANRAEYEAWRANHERTQAVEAERNFVEEKLMAHPEWVIVFKALGRILASELSQVRTNPIVPLPARTQNQFITALRQAVADIIAEDINTNTVVIPNP